MKREYAALPLIPLLLQLSSTALAAVPQVEMNVSADSVARIALYYRDVPLTGDSIDFPLPINGKSQHFEKTSDFFYIVGNVDQAEIVFSDAQFILYSTNAMGRKINLSGNFIYKKTESTANRPLSVKVISNISEATVESGFKVHFKSEFPSANYSQGSYANSFTMVVKPII